MKKSEKDQFVAMSIKDLYTKAKALKKQMIEDLLKRKTTNVKNMKFLGTQRKKLAVILTIIRMREFTTGGAKTI